MANLTEKSANPRIWCQRICLSVCLSACLSVCLSVMNFDLNHLRTGLIVTFLAENNYPDSHHLQEGMKFDKQISPLLNYYSISNDHISTEPWLFITMCNCKQYGNYLICFKDGAPGKIWSVCLSKQGTTSLFHSAGAFIRGEGE